MPVCHSHIPTTGRHPATGRLRVTVPKSVTTGRRRAADQYCSLIWAAGTNGNMRRLRAGAAARRHVSAASPSKTACANRIGATNAAQDYECGWRASTCFWKIVNRRDKLGPDKKKGGPHGRPSRFKREAKPSPARLREVAADAVEARLLLVAERAVEAVECGLHRVGCGDHGLAA